MDFELYPTVTLSSRSFNVLLAPREMFIQALNRNLNLQRFKVLYVTGNYSAILSRLDRSNVYFTNIKSHQKIGERKALAI